MVEICSHTIVKNGAEFLKPVLEQILPYVTRALISIDNRSNDGTIEIIEELKKKYNNIEVNFFAVDNRGIGLTTEKNRNLKRTTEKWIWHVDDDEYWPTEQIEKLMGYLKEATNEIAFAVIMWQPMDKEHYYAMKSYKGFQHRIFRNKPTLEYKPGSFWVMGERLYDKGIHVWHKKPGMNVRSLRDVEYVHLTALKKSTWRGPYPRYHFIKLEEGSPYLKKLPPHIKKIVSKLTNG